MKLSFSLSDPAQKRRALLIPILGLGLVWSLSGEADDPIQEPSSRRAKAERPPADSRALPSRTKTWTELSLAEITAFNPFVLPEATKEPEPSDVLPSETESQVENVTPAAPPLEKWELERVSIIYQGPTGPLAVIGDKTVGIGQMLDENTLVVDIRDDGVWVSEVKAEPLPNPPVQPILPDFPELLPGLSGEASKVGK
jgi:hypothetical protein